MISGLVFRLQKTALSYMFNNYQLFQSPRFRNSFNIWTIICLDVSHANARYSQSKKVGTFPINNGHLVLQLQSAFKGLWVDSLKH